MICSNSRVTSALISSKVGSFSPARGRIASLIGPAKVVRVNRSASRKSRLMRFRSCAFPCRLDRKMPYRNSSAGSQTAVQDWAGRRLPCLKRAAISTRLFRVKLRGSLFLTANADCQALATFGATTRQHFAAVLGRHPATEAMVVQFLTVGRLKRSFHCYSTLILTEPPNIATLWISSRGIWSSDLPHFEAQNRLTFKAACLVSAVAERFARRLATAAERKGPLFYYYRPVRERYLGAGAFNTGRRVRFDRDPDISQVHWLIPRILNVLIVLPA